MDDKPSVDALVSVYIKIRDARDAARKEADRIEADYEEQMEIINQQILKVCEETGADSIKTAHGTAIRTVKSRYWTNDWERFYDFIFEHKVPELLERRVHQTNIKQFLEENPDLLPAGLNVDSAYSITVRRSK
jgi:predicted metal-dependent phosphotriesterase family hydrolase